MSFFGKLFEDPAMLALLGGAAIAATGGLAAPALAGAAGTATAGAAGGTGLLAGAGAEAAATGLLTGEAAGAAAATEGVVGAGLSAGEAAAAGNLSQFQQAKQYLKPVGQAMDAAGKVKGLLATPEQAPVQGQPVTVGQGGGGALNALYQQIEQGDMQRMQAEREKRMRQQQNLYGGA